VIKEIREETNKFLESTENENTTYQYLWDTAKAMLRVMFMAISVYIKKPETSQIKKKTNMPESCRNTRTNQTPKQQTGRNNKDKS
jgi:hypothetical protein